MSINLTDEIDVKTKKGKLGTAKQIFLEGDTTSLQKAHEDNQAHFDTLDNRSSQMEESIKNISVTGGASVADAVTYDNTTSGLEAVNVKGAVDELATKNKSQDAEISKKANSADVTSLMQTEQSRVNTELAKKFNSENIAQESGEAEDKVMSQKAVSNKFNDTNKRIDNTININLPILNINYAANTIDLLGERTINLLNYTNSEKGIVNNSGKLDNNTAYSSSHFIEVKEDTKYISNFTMYRVVEFDKNFNVIGFISGVNYREFTTSSNTKYVRICVDREFNVSNQVCEDILNDGKVYPYFLKFKHGACGELTNDDFKTISYNLFNPENREVNKIPSAGYNVLYKDSLSDNSNFWGIGLIPVENGKTYSFYYGSNAQNFNLNKVFGYDSMMRNVGEIPAQNIGYNISDERIKYISGYLSNGYLHENVMLIEGNVQPLSFFPYNPIPYFKSKELALKEYFIDFEKGQSVTRKDIYGITLEYKNLITSYENKWLSSDSVGKLFFKAVEEETNDYGKISTNLIPVQKGIDVYLFLNSYPSTSDNRQAIEIDENGIVLSIMPFSSGTNKYTLNSKKAAYIAVQWPKGFVQATLLYENEIKNNAIYFMNKRLAYFSDILLWSGKKVCTYGDSITEYGFWQSSLSHYFGFSEVVNRGISGSKLTNIDPFQYWVNSITGEKISTENVEEPDPTWENPLRIYSNFSNQERINTVPIDCDLVIIMGGTNDTGATNPSTNTGDCNFDEHTGAFKENTIMGAVCETIRKMQIRCPNAVIVFATPLSGLNSYSDNKNYNQSFKINEMAKAIKDACFYMSIPVIDVFGTCGINISNSAKYLREDKVHPTYGNDKYNGASMISRAMIGGLLSILPMLKG